jgi:hypothetical protein
MGDNKRKHLDFIQSVITRMNSNSFLLKGWTVTLVAALFAFAAKEAKPAFALITYLPIPIFWYLDAFYLSQERQYIALYNKVRSIEEEDIDFDMNASVYNTGRNTISGTFFSVTLRWFYLSLLVITILIMIKVIIFP